MNAKHFNSISVGNRIKVKVVTAEIIVETKVKTYMNPTTGNNMKLAMIENRDTLPKYASIMGEPIKNAINIEETLCFNFSGKNLSALLKLGVKIINPNAIEKDSKNPTVNSKTGEINKTKIIDNEIEDNLSYLSPKHLENSKTEVITVALTEEAEKPQTPE